MICKNCNAEVNSSSSFCTKCGTPIEKEPIQPVYQSAPEQPVYQPAPEQPVYQQYQQPQYQAAPQTQQYQQPYQNTYQQPYQQPVYQPAYQQPETAPVTKISSYIGWIFLSAFSFLIIPFIIMIVFAVDSSNKNRANFFRAQFAIVGIMLALLVVVGIIAAIAGLSIIDMMGI